MKIESDYGVGEGLRYNRAKGGSGVQTSFSDLLAKAVAEDEPQTSSSAPISAPATPAAMGGSELPILWHQVNGLLESLDRYAEALGDPSKSLKDLEPLAGDLERQADSLDQGLAGQSDETLAGLASQALTQARVEAFKFRRGDYL